MQQSCLYVDLSEIPTSSFNCLVEKTVFPIYPQLLQIMKELPLIRNSGIFQNGNNHSKQRLFQFWNLSVQYTEQISLESVQWAKHIENL